MSKSTEIESLESKNVDELVDRKKRLKMRLTASHLQEADKESIKNKIELTNTEIQRRQQKRNEEDINNGRKIKHMKIHPKYVEPVEVDEGEIELGEYR